MKIIKPTAQGYLLLIKISFDNNRNKHDYYSGKGSMENFSKDLKEHVTEIIN